MKALSLPFTDKVVSKIETNSILSFSIITLNLLLLNLLAPFFYISIHFLFFNIFGSFSSKAEIGINYHFCGYQGVKNVSFLENFAQVLNE